MHPHSRPRRRPSRTPLHGTAPRSPGGRKFHPVDTRISIRGHGLSTPSPLRFPPVLCLHVSCHQPERHLLPTFRALNSTPLPILVRRPRSRHPSPVHRLQLRPHRLVRVVDHSECLPNVSLQYHPIEQADQGAEIPLEPFLD